MADEPNHARVTERVSWWLVERLSQALEPGEREAVRGDLAEARERGSRALAQVLGLVLRRQAELWEGWRPWATLIGLILPLSLLLSLISRRGASGSAVYVWMYVNNFYWGLLSNRGFWHVLPESAGRVLTIYITLACWAWTAGFVVGAASRRMIRMNAALLCLMLLFGELVGAPLYLAIVSAYMHRLLPGQRVTLGIDPAPALMFYRIIFPLLIQAVVVALPAVWGMRRGSELARLRPFVRAVLWTAAIATLGILLLQQVGFVLLLRQIFGFGLDSWQMRWLRFFWHPHAAPLIVYWPIAYIVARAIARRWHTTIQEATAS